MKDKNLRLRQTVLMSGACHEQETVIVDEGLMSHSRMPNIFSFAKTKRIHFDAHA